MNSVSRISQKASCVVTHIQQKPTQAPRFLMSTPASLKCYEPEEYARVMAGRRQWDNLRIVLNECGADVEIFEKNGTSLPCVTEVGSTALIRDGVAYVPRDRSLRGIVRRQFIETWAHKTGYALKYVDAAPNPRNMVKISNNLVLTSPQNGISPNPMDLGAEVTVAQAKKINHKLQTLDTVFCALDSKTALFVREAFEQKTIDELSRKFTLIEVPRSEAEKFACNSIVLVKKVILPRGCDQTAKSLQHLGYEPVFVTLNSLAGGPLKYALRIA